MRSLSDNLKPRPGSTLRLSSEDRKVEVNSLFVIWLFDLLLQASNQAVGAA